MSEHNPEIDGTQFIIEVAWDRPDLPGVVGPFDDRAEAETWGELNISNGAWMVVPIAYPYMRSEDPETAETYSVHQIREAFTKHASNDDWAVPSFYEDGLIAALRGEYDDPSTRPGTTTDETP